MVNEVIAKEDVLPPAEDVLTAITQHYMESGDFNGITPPRLAETLGRPVEDLVRDCHTLVSKGLVTISWSGNFHIKAFPAAPISTQIEQLAQGSPLACCLYPAREHLEAIVDRSLYDGRPYSLQLALGRMPSNRVSFL